MPEKPKVIDEIWDDARVRMFLDVTPPADTGRDFHRLLTAYRAMRIADFERFLEFFRADGGDLDARDPQGRRIDDVLEQHRLAGPFREALARARTDLPG